MHHHSVLINGQVYIAVTGGKLDHPQGVEKLMGLLRNGQWAWRHNLLDKHYKV